MTATPEDKLQALPMHGEKREDWMLHARNTSIGYSEPFRGTLNQASIRAQQLTNEKRCRVEVYRWAGSIPYLGGERQ